MTYVSVRVRWLVGVMAGLGASFWVGAAEAQVGTGWVQYEPTSSIQLDGSEGIESYPGDSTNLSNEGASYTNVDGVETFTLNNPISNRAERRMRNDYTSGRRQFEGEVRVFPPTNDESITQVFGGTSGATTQMLRAYNVDNGTIRKVPGSVVLASNIYGTWVRINVVHDVGANNVKTYVNGKLMATGDGEAPASWYHKYGCYGTLRTPSAKVEWRNVKHFRDGENPPPGTVLADGGAGDAAPQVDAGGGTAAGPTDAAPTDAQLPDDAGSGGAGGAGGGRPGRAAPVERREPGAPGVGRGREAARGPRRPTRADPRAAAVARRRRPSPLAPKSPRPGVAAESEGPASAGPALSPRRCWLA